MQIIWVDNYSYVTYPYLLSTYNSIIKLELLIKRLHLYKMHLFRIY